MRGRRVGEAAGSACMHACTRRQQPKGLRNDCETVTQRSQLGGGGSGCHTQTASCRRSLVQQAHHAARRHQIEHLYAGVGQRQRRRRGRHRQLAAPRLQHKHPDVCGRLSHTQRSGGGAEWCFKRVAAMGATETQRQHPPAPPDVFCRQHPTLGNESRFTAPSSAVCSSDDSSRSSEDCRQEERQAHAAGVRASVQPG